MFTLLKKISLVASFLLFSSQSNASIITNAALPNVDDYTVSNALILWDTVSNISGSIESFDLSLTWYDQGWGNKKGNIYYEIDNLGPVHLKYLNTHNVVTETLSVSNLMGPVNGSLKLFYTVGGGGGHALHIRDASLSITSVPEPSVIALMAIGLAGVGFTKRKKKLLIK